ncbi:DUF4244 domain-containing protein [Arthrobacter sp. ATA002]|uniref:DUF4244 domain-containing protein n=1 Tax=Arthrobacter sp. ATA002 TaxID=2991715 RepID=UPI0022A68265|nr:DUF4244 domain-containing protein [Arthrobacter sp. ATA002]WAP52357.1 DUF4244 domain-containing protein [Arthrobacter sp. ATA002]
MTVLYPAEPSAGPDNVFQPDSTQPDSTQSESAQPDNIRPHIAAPGSRTWERRKAGRLRASFQDREAGMATAEYAIATLAAVAFAALLVAVLGSGEVRSLLMGLIRSALTLG